MADPQLIGDHIARALEGLPSVWKDATRLRSLVSLFVDEVQLLEDTAYAMIVERRTYTAVGAQLDQLGGVVGETRQGLTDEEYRGFLRARLLTNAHEADIVTLTDIVARITGATSVQYVPAPPATFTMQYTVKTPLSSTLRARILEQFETVITSGVQGQLVETQPGYFGFSADPGALGFGEGFFATLIE